MKEQKIDLAELQELKEQFGLLNKKLEKQQIVTDELIKESMSKQLSHVERWYQNRIRTATIAAPIVGIYFILHYYPLGIAYWSLGVIVILAGLLEYFLHKRSYRALDPKGLPSMSMTEATERVLRHKQMVTTTNRIMALPLIAIIVWVILIAGDFTLRWKVIAITCFAMGVSLLWGYALQRKNRKHLEEVLRQIKSLRE
ncbi:MAG: hypothetical protein Q4A18_00405 [Rikenellaceae bacterium]|nr:hypothetical protein [Rikenellaceae bacterium]